MLPKLPYQIPTREQKSIVLRGLNLTDDYQEGAILSCRNLSSRRYPYMATRSGRKLVNTGVSSIYGWNDLFYIKGGKLYYGTRQIGTLAAGNKQMVMINTKLVIWPDKKYVDMTDMTLKTIANAPDMDFICESDNRIWGCSSATQTIYCCSLGDPTTWDDYSDLSTGAYAVAVGSKGNFTGCIKLASSVLFFKEKTIHKMLGSYPEEYTLYTYEVQGVRPGCNKSMVVNSETLYFVGTDGIYAYSGGAPHKISTRLGDLFMDDARAGITNETYYLSGIVNGQHRLFTYDLNYGVWMEEDDFNVTDMTTIGEKLYMCNSEGNLYEMNVPDADATDLSSLTWNAVFKPFFAHTSTSRSSNVNFNKKRYHKMVFRLDIPEGSSFESWVKFDSKEWKAAGTVNGSKENLHTFVVPIERCDKFELKLNGNGPCTILNFDIQYKMGSEK